MKSLKEKIIESAPNLFCYLPNQDRDEATSAYNDRVFARLETVDHVLKYVPKTIGVDLLSNSAAILDRVEKHQQKHGEIPEWHEGLSTISHNAITDANWFISNSPNLLQDFFNSKSDANKYLSAEQQEDLESDFKNFVISQIAD